MQKQRSVFSNGLGSVKRYIYIFQILSKCNLPVKLPDSSDATVEASSPSRGIRTPLSYRTQTKRSSTVRSVHVRLQELLSGSQLLQNTSAIRLSHPIAALCGA